MAKYNPIKYDSNGSGLPKFPDPIPIYLKCDAHKRWSNYFFWIDNGRALSKADSFYLPNLRGTPMFGVQPASRACQPDFIREVFFRETACLPTDYLRSSADKSLSPTWYVAPSNMNEGHRQPTSPILTWNFLPPIWSQK